MKFVIVFLSLALIWQLGNSELRFIRKHDLINRLSPRANKFEQALEDLKEILRKGNETAGIPVLDPFNLDHKTINIRDNLTQIQAEVNKLLLEGISYYTVQKAAFTLKKISIDLLWSEIATKTEYNITDSVVLGKFPVYGVGDVSVLAEDFRFATEANINLQWAADRMSVSSFENTVLTLKNLKVNFNGLYEDDELSALVSAVISDNAADYLKDFQAIIVTKLNAVMLEGANNFLSTKSLKEIIKKLRG